MSMHNRGNEWQPEIIWFFSAENYSTETKLDFNCVFSWHIYMCIPNFNSKCSFVMQIMSGNQYILEFFQVQRAWLCRKLFNRTHIRSQRAYSRDTSRCTYIPNFNSTCQFVMQIMSGNWKLLEFKCKGYNSAENYSIRTKFELNLRVLVAILCTKFHVKIPMCDRDSENERKLNPDGMTEVRKGVTLYASAFSWRGHKRVFFYHYIYARR